MPCKCACDVEPVLHDHDHDETTAQQMNVHVPHADRAKALDHLGPDAAVMFPVGRNRLRIVTQIDGQHVLLHDQLTTLCRDSPKPSIPRATTSPAFKYTGAGRMPSATPAGVPVLMTSPGSSVMN